MRDQLFIAMADRAKQQVPELQTIDWDWGQLEVPEDWYPVLFDALFISFPSIDWKSYPGKYQQGDILIRLRLAIDMIPDTHIMDGVVAPDRAAAVTKMQLVNKLFAAFQYWEAAGWTPLQRVSSIEEQRSDGLKVIVEDFICTIEDRAAMPVGGTATVVPGLQVTGELADQLP